MTPRSEEVINIETQPVDAEVLRPGVVRLEQSARLAYRKLKFATRRAITGFGISHAAFHVLATAAEQGTVPIGALCSGVGVTSSTMSSVLDSLEGRGLIERLRTDADRRVVLVTVTPAGQALVDELLAFRRRLFAEAVRDLDDATLAAMVTGFSRLAERLPAED